MPRWNEIWTRERGPLLVQSNRILAATPKLEKRWDETPSEQARRQRFRELCPLDPGLTYGMRDTELPSPKESRPGHHSNGVVRPPLRGSTPQDPNMAKLDYLWTALDKLESRMDAYDRRLERLERLRSPARQPSGWDSPAHCAARRYSAYDRSRRSTCWDRPLYGQPPYTDMDSSYAPPRQYTALNFGQPPYTSDESPQKSYAGYHLGQQEYQPSHRRAAASPAPAAAPPPLLHVDQRRSPSCCHPTSHLRQAEACLELPTTVQQPLLQRPPFCLYPPSFHSVTKLVSCEEKNLGIEANSKVWNQVDLRLNEKKLVDSEVRAIEVNKIDEDNGLHDSSKIAAFGFDGCLAKTSVNGVNADTWSLVSPSILEKLHNRYKDELHDAREDTVNGLKDMSIYSRMGVKRMGELDNKPFHDTIMWKFAEDVYIGDAIVGYWRLKQRSCPFDPGGDASPKLLLSTLFVASWFPP